MNLGTSKLQLVSSIPRPLAINKRKLAVVSTTNRPTTKFCQDEVLRTGLRQQNKHEFIPKLNVVFKHINVEQDAQTANNNNNNVKKNPLETPTFIFNHGKKLNKFINIENLKRRNK